MEVFSNNKFCLLLFAIILCLVGANIFAVGTQEEAKEPVELVVLCHKVHQTAMEGVEGGGANMVAKFIAENPGVKDVKFLTAGTSDVISKLYRESALDKSSIDVGFITDSAVSPDVKNYFLPIDDFIKTQSIEDYEDIFKGLKDIFVFGGKAYGIPMRSGGNLLYYNKEYVKQAGISISSAGNMTMEEIIDLMKKTSFTKANGDKVYGFVKQGEKTEIGRTVGYFLRAKDGDYYTPDYELKFQDKKVIWAINVIKDMYQSGALPPNFTAVTNKDVVQLFKSGRGTFYSGGPGYLKKFTTGDGALPIKNVGFMNFPAAKEYKSKYPEAAPIATFAWGMVIPKGAQHKDLSWKFIKAMLSKEAILNGCLSGNSPVRASTFEEPKYKAGVPFLKEQLAMFKDGRTLFPGFDGYAELRDILGEEMQLVVLGKKTAEQAMADAEEKCRPLMPK